MSTFWNIFRKNLLQFHRGIFLLVFGFGLIGWHFYDYFFLPESLWHRLEAPMRLYGGLFFIATAVFVIWIAYLRIRRAQQPRA